MSQLTAFFLLSFCRDTFLPEGAFVGLWNFAWGFKSTKTKVKKGDPPAPPGGDYLGFLLKKRRVLRIAWKSDRISAGVVGGLSRGSSMLRPRPTWASAEIIIIFHPFIFIVCTKDNYFVLTTLTKFGAFEGVWQLLSQFCASLDQYFQRQNLWIKTVDFYYSKGVGLIGGCVPFERKSSSI